MRAVRSLCARIRSDDYIPGVFDEWVRDRRGRFWVAVEEDRVIGIAKLTLIGDDEAWLHALRVDPLHRRKGVATALLAHRLERARRLGARVARLDTQEDNTAVQRMMRRFGFRRREVDGYFERRARSIAAPRRASRADLPAVARLAVGALLQDPRVARDRHAAAQELLRVAALGPSARRLESRHPRAHGGAAGSGERGRGVARRHCGAVTVLAGAPERGLSETLESEIHLRTRALGANAATHFCRASPASPHTARWSAPCCCRPDGPRRLPDGASLLTE
jgi:ribosomal protein S18 acetylase RimI-like enzyme